ncbi:MAG TPA: chromosome segregation protein SMC, partial [Verrucomicrobiae bacterium]|nr:chromosome segregation protein SMC [Verrucomicrobiae bacterium]
KAADEELTAVAARLRSSEAALAANRESLHSRQQALDALEKDLQNRQDSLRQAQADAFAAAQDLSRVRNEITALDLQKQGNSVRLEKLSAEKIQLEEERSRLESRLQEFASHVETEKLTVQTQRGTVEERQRRLVEIQDELNKASQEQEQRLQQQAEKRSRFDVLEQLEGSHEGFGAGALAALRRSVSVIGSLADRIRVPAEYVVAIENALGHHLQLVLTEQPESAQQILAELSASRTGRASVAALAVAVPENQLVFSGDMAPGESVLVQNRLSKGEVVPALSVIATDESVGKLVRSLLGHTFIASNLSSATAQLQNGHAGCDFVTLSGDLLSRHGVYTGGYLNGSGDSRAPSSILGRKNQIAELRAELGRLQEDIAAISRRKGALQSEQTELQAGLQQAQTELRRQEVAIATREGEFTALENSRRLLHQKIETVMYEVQSLAAQEAEGMQKRAALSDRAAELQAREQARQADVAALTAELDQLRQQRESANARLTECKVALAAEQQLCASFAQQHQALGARIREVVQAIDQRRSECVSFVERKESSEREIVESRGHIEHLRHEREQVNARGAQWLAQKQEQETDVLTREEGLREDRRGLAASQEQRSALEVELAQKNMSAENLRERIQQKYHLRLDDIRSECITITFAEEGPAKVHVMTPEEMAAAGAATDWAVVAQQIELLQTRLDEIGPVNLVAIEEYEETEQRYQFLSKQHDDLVQAKAQLLEVINRINTQTRQMFLETFESIRMNFRAMFTEVFGGGKADLVLVDENDVLESGIDIVARPPGKQLQTISLLSGGEQTMTAVALLFSIYQVRPSPFCVLDELDAPLDESNINRFVLILQRFLANSQFIIITHNKRTIGMADVLYGVTMQEHGISKIVSVKFHKSTDDGSQPGVSLDTPVIMRPEEDTARKRDEAEISMSN